MLPRKKKISTILPSDLLAEAGRLTKVNQTETLILALKELVRSFKRESIVNLKGKLDISFEVAKERQRNRF